jgi:PAS domain S-box-containing protein
VSQPNGVIPGATATIRMRLGDSDDLFRVAFENAPIGMILASSDLASIHVNRALCEMLGYSEEELLACGAWAFTHPEDVAPNLAYLQRALAGEIDSYDMEKRYVHRDGHIVWGHLNGSLVRDPSGAPRYFISQIQDVGARKAEAELAETRHGTRQVLERITDAFYALDRDWRFAYINAAAERVFARPREEMLGKDIWTEFASALETPVYAAYQRAMGKGTSIELEFFYPAFDAWYLVNAYPSENGLSVFFRDVTEQRRLIQDLRASEARYRTLVEHLPAVVYEQVNDERQTSTYFSPQFATLTGYSMEEIMDQPPDEHWHDFLHPDDRVRVAADEARSLELNEPFRSEYRLTRRDGSYVWVRDECVPIHDELGNIVAWQGVMLDITDRIQAEQAFAAAQKLAEDALRASLDAAQAASQAKSAFLATMSHELRTPLQAVLGYSEFLQSPSGGPLTVEQREDIGYIHQGAKRMMLLISQMLDLSRIEAGALHVSRSPVDLRVILEEVRQDVALVAAAKGVELTIEAPATLPHVFGDALRLRQILLNLVSNAVKFTERGLVRVGAFAGESGVAVSVQDTGIGIAPEALPHIFEEFRQVESTLARRHGGAGLGLAIAQKLAALMGYQIRVESDVGVGSTFSLHLDAAPATDTS